MQINFLNNVTNFYKKNLPEYLIKPLFPALLVIVVVGIIYSIFSSSNQESETTIAKIGELKQFVEVTGQVQSSRDANLAFQTVGSVSYIGAKVGDIVPQGKILATLQSGDAQASILQAKAQLESAEATLGQLTQGYRKEEIAIKQQTVDNAKNSLDLVYISLPDTIRSVDSTTVDVVKNKLGTVFVLNGSTYNLSFISCDQSFQSKIESDRAKLEIALNDFQKKSSVISNLSSKEDLDLIFDQAYDITVTTNNIVNDLSKLLFASCSIQNASLDSTRTILSTARTTMSALFSEITTKRNSLSSARNTLSQAERDLELANAGTDPYKLKTQSALVTQAQAQVAQAEANYRKTLVVSPFSGVISEVLITEGETVTSGKTVISMLAVDSFEIEAKIPEIDIVKIKNNLPVEVTLDAYGKAVVFPAKVTRVNPTATIEGSVPVYKAIITFEGNDKRIKSGMTANIKIITENKPHVLILPARFVNMENEAQGVIVLRKNNIDTEQKVTLGVRGQDGLIEILSGLNEGDEVVAPAIGLRSAQKQTQ